MAPHTSALKTVRGVLARLAGPDVAVALWSVDVTTTDSFAVEEIAVRNAVPERQEEFRRGRACARAALGTLGGPAESISVGSNREPVWPSGYVGSITHCGPVVAAAVARAGALAGLGLDVERAEALEEGVERLVMRSAERAASCSDAPPPLDAAAGSGPPPADALSGPVAPAAAHPSAAPSSRQVHVDLGMARMLRARCGRCPSGAESTRRAGCQPPGSPGWRRFGTLFFSLTASGTVR